MSTARVALSERLAGDSQLNALGINAASIFNANDVDSPEARPFVIIVWGDEARPFGGAGRRSVSVWAHDAGTSYQVIDQILSRVQELIDSSVHITGTDGSRISVFNYQGSSGDLVDDGYGTVTRYASWEALPH